MSAYKAKTDIEDVKREAEKIKGCMYAKCDKGKLLNTERDGFVRYKTEYVDEYYHINCWDRVRKGA